eukprot:TRINITY_DN47702_c0_g1_i1.p1 TRINITY_DN47702_c0_g1~~TRINITY_DN47702_c0_g1_i1.p1  ORF type:complete len:766 (+),score=254.05 TRINITY_DN47702_c0_g1_i1:83-2299(+)
MASDDNGRTYLERIGLTDNGVMALSPVLQGYTLQEDDVLDVARGLADNWSLTSLELCRCNVTADGALALAAALEVNHTLRYLGLAKNRVQDTGVTHLASALAENQSLEIIDLSGNGIRDAGALAIAQMLELQPETRPDKKCGELRTLVLENNRIGKAGAAALGAALRQTSKLKSLNLSRNRLMEAGAIALAAGLAENTSLTQLCVGHNSINDIGCAALAKALCINRSVTVLHVNANRLAGAAGAYAEMLNSNSAIRDLSLENCFIGAEHAKQFADSLRDSALLSINLGHNPLGDEGILHMCRAFRGKPVRYFDLSEVGLSPQGINPVCDFVNIAPCLQTLQLDGNRLAPEQLRELCRIIATNTTIDSLNLEATGLGTKGAATLAEALRNNASMRSLVVADNEIGDEGCVALCSTLSRMRRVSEVDFGSNGITEAPIVVKHLCSLFTNNTGLQRVKLEDNPLGDNFPGGLMSREAAEEMYQGTLPGVEALPLSRKEGREREFASPLTAQSRVDPPTDEMLAARGSVRPGAAGLMCAADTLFRPAWAPAVPPQRIYGDEVMRSVDDEDEDEAEDGRRPPLMPAKGSLLHPLYPGFGKGRCSNEHHADTLDGCCPLPLAHTVGRAGTESSYNTMKPGFMFLQPPRRAAKRSPYSLDMLESNVASLPVTEEMLRRKFQELDVDGSGSLEYDEFKVIFTNFQNFGVYQAEAEVEELFKKYKVMDDGRISFDEFALIMLSLARR